MTRIASKPRVLCVRCQRGFSLVEVLIAVLVLSLGLLGIGAVFPVIVRQQRIATQTTMGNSAKQGIKQILANNANFAADGRGWPAVRSYVVSNASNPGDWVPLEVDRSTGNYDLDPDPNDPNANQVILPLSQRLYPLPMVSQTAPQFVWDMAARLIEPGDINNSALEVAVFVRPIDPGIRRPINKQTGKPYSLTTTLLDPFNEITGREQRFPVGVGRNGRPTFDGKGMYSMPVVAELSLPGTNPEPKFVLLDKVLSPNTDVAIATQVLSVPDKRFYGRNGKLYRVVSTTTLGSGSSKRTVFEIDPPIEDVNGDAVADENDINPILFVPQNTPVKPFLFQVQPRSF